MYCFLFVYATFWKHLYERRMWDQETHRYFIYIYIYIFIYIFGYIPHHFILLRINLIDLNVDRKGWWFEHSVSELGICWWAEGAKNVSWPYLSPLRGWGTYIYIYMLHVHIYIYIYIHIYAYIYIYNTNLVIELHISCVQVLQMPLNHFGNNQEGTFSSWLHMCYAHFDSARFQHLVWKRGSVKKWKIGIKRSSVSKQH